MKSPIEQFEVVPLLNLEIYESKIDLTITNLFLANIVILLFILLLTHYIVPKSHNKTKSENVVFYTKQMATFNRVLNYNNFATCCR